MKNELMEIFGNELKWFKRLKKNDKIKIVYACISVMAVLMVVESLLLTVILSINAIIAVYTCRGISSDGLDE